MGFIENLGHGLPSSRFNTRMGAPSISHTIWLAFHFIVKVWNAAEGSKGSENWDPAEQKKKQKRARSEGRREQNQHCIQTTTHIPYPSSLSGMLLASQQEEGNIDTETKTFTLGLLHPYRTVQCSTVRQKSALTCARSCFPWATRLSASSTLLGLLYP